jgi:hypothetical protein
VEIRDLEKLDLGKTERSLVDIRAEDAFEEYFFALARPEWAARLPLKIFAKTIVGSD